MLLVLVALVAGCAARRSERRMAMAAIDAPSVPLLAVPPADPAAVTICSFNIQFLGLSISRLNDDLATLLAPCDLAVIQEIIAPGVPGTYPDGSPYTVDAEVKEFFDAMVGLGFSFDTSPEDTGPGTSNQKNSSATEWFVVFYKPAIAQPAPDLPHGFVAADVTAHPVYARVPYAHAFRSTDGLLDFVIVNVHLTPGDSEDAERAAELAEIAAWVSSVEGPERDFLIVGDMNLYTTTEIAAATPTGFLSLNDEADKTNTATTARPYDHVMYRPAHSTEVDDPFDQQEVDLVAAMEPTWPGPGAYPGNPYAHDPFRAYYSDHRPIVVRLRRPAADDD